ncbi:hypothetical protein CI109_105362 [Kwoniella shandongensis]|uniref:ATP-dependent DNA helicase n=1 Tax=Kwoniella shandongensis TaxID=1734106 RepID=A0A5M6BS00_9TREE|nr:uncharacterized protein CI109_006947 [Kwoniella shandongensis]KAA5524740.1 hypothetical protein CI109_006947 [Kwoniella shandongensis]
MSDDDFGDDSFLVDDSFLAEIDNITASAQVQPKLQALPKSTNNVDIGRSASLVPTSGNNNNNNNRGWTGIQRSHSGPSGKSNKLTTISSSGAARRARALLAPPSSDDYDSLPLPAESLVAFDNLTSRPVTTSKTSSNSISNRSKPTLGGGQSNPSSRIGGFARSASGSFLQTHLNFRRDKQSTKGKRWDRTEFAESGRRVGAEKGRGKGKGKGKGTAKRKGRDWDEEEEDGAEDLEDDDDWGDIMAPPPKLLVDINAPYEPQRHLPNSATIDTYIYPTNRSKRDYQYEIVRACFMDNCLVALPTGLGKTFVAGVVMLNFYRWFPTGKIVFLAPTRPLVNQQIEACQLTCGIPSKDAAVMTGSSVPAKERIRLWEERRVFYCTPQTLDNDLRKGAVDARDIVLAVFDEAHKASGSYAYTTILALLTAHHPYFRVLALTATPGADVPRVQAVVDALHISRIEIREAEAPDIKKYMNEKRTEKHFVQMGDVIEGFRDRWAALMKPYVAKLVDKDILTDRDLDIKRLRPFRLTAKRMEIAKDRTSGLKWAFGSLQSLEKMARAMGNLLEFSIGMFHTSLSEIAGGTNAAGKKSNTKGSAGSIRNNFEFQKLLRDVETEINMIRIGKDGKSKADKHPKMAKTLELLLAHFSQAEEEEKSLGQKNDTRAMVFCSYRDCVLEVVDMLNQHSGLLRATKFVGQSQGKQEADKGFNQKEQKKTINEFKEGKYNILVATSIGEEGLDIGEVDFVVIYDMPKQSIKLLQRVGRTGRKRDGKVHVLMSEGREDANWDSAQQTHREIQEEILHSRNLELFEDVEPLLPEGKFPECIEQEMEIDPWDPDDKKFKKTLAEVEKTVRKAKEKELGAGKATSKAKGKAASTTKTVGRGHEVPEGAGGFKSVAQLLREAKKLVSSTAGGFDGEEEEEEHEGVEDRPKPRGRGKAATTAATSNGRGKKRGREPSPVRSESESESDEDEDGGDLEAFFATTGGATTVGAKKTTKATAPASKRSRKDSPDRSKTKSARQVQRKADSDLEINSASDHSDVAVVAAKNLKSKAKLTKAELKRQKQEGEKQAALDKSALDFFHTEGPLRRGMGRPPSPVMITPPSSPDSPDRVVEPPSPGLNEVAGTTTTIENKLTPRTAAMAGFSQIAPLDLSWNLGDDDDDDADPSAMTPAMKDKSSMPPPPLPSISRNPLSSSPLANTTRSDSAISYHQQATQFPVRPRLGMRRPRPVVVSSGGRDSAHSPTGPGPEDDSPFRGLRPPGAAGLRRAVVQSSEPDSPLVPMRRGRVVLPSSSPGEEATDTRPEEGRRRRGRVGQEDGGRRARVRDEEANGGRTRRSRVVGKANKFLDMDASLSGSDSGDSSEHSDSSVASSSDLRFAGNFQPTQAPKGYNQQAMYLAGLGTQARGHGLEFRRDFGKERDEFLGKARRPVYITDDEDSDTAGGGVGLRGGGGGRGDENSDNDYELGSFVVDDEEDVGFVSQSDPISFS